MIMYYPTNEDIAMLNQSCKTVHIWTSLLNLDFQLIDSIKGNLISDTFSIDATSDNRRIFSGTYVVNNQDISIGLEKKIWVDRYVKIEFGTVNSATGELKKYPLGIFVVDDINTEFSNESSTITISCSDLSSTLNGTVNGDLISTTAYEEGSDIRNAMIETITKLGGFKKYRISNTEKKIPYKLEISNTMTIWKLITDIRDLYAGWEAFFDIDGTFVFQPIPTCENDPVMLQSEHISPLVVRESVNYDIKKIRNTTLVYGKCLKNDYYSSDVSGDGIIYTVTFSTAPNFTNGTTIAIKMNVNNKSNPKLSIGGSTFATVNDDDKIISSDVLEKDNVYLFRYRRNKWYLQGRWQIAGVVKEVLSEQSQIEIEYDYEKYNTKNIKYIVNPESPYAIEHIGERLNRCIGGNFEQITSDSLALQRAEYENWLKTRLVDTVSVEIPLIPWLNMNEKLEYTKKQTKETYQYITKKMSGSISQWTCTLEMTRFFPLYPFVVEQ